MSADNFVHVKRFGENDYRWGEWSASDDEPNYSDKNFDSASFASPALAAENAREELTIIEYGISFCKECFRAD